jgi:basic membrane protein A
VIVVILVAGVGAIVILGPILFPSTPRVAIVFATGGLGDKSFNDAAYKGAVDFRTAHPDWTFTYAEPTQISEYEGFLRDYAVHEGRAAYDIIISIGFDQNASLFAVATDYPNQSFAIVDMFTGRPNVASLLFNANEGSALVGAIAGLMTVTDKIGFVGGMDIPLINEFAAGYRFGANYTNPDIPVSIQYTGSWVDTTAGQTLANGLYAAGNDVIFAAAGRSGLGVFTSAKTLNGTEGYDNKLWVIGVDSPQMYLGCEDTDNPAPPTLSLTSMLKRVDVAVFNTIKEVYDGTFTGGAKIFKLSNGGVGYEVNTALLTLPPAVITAVEALKAAIIAGTVTVPTAL